ncbi:general secretion pathway protein A [Geobacillus thermodenitrificans]|nr:general secretion pathway protein A [Geobacillus thermodenitrificans]NNU89016.1 general secretion pathway protein A [Geobacillus sp. MR]PTR45810.1 general secretion pathway protein A [Geobacillus thermodenitrificans]
MKGAESASFVLFLFHRSIRRAGNLHLKERANVPKECAKSGTRVRQFEAHFRQMKMPEMPLYQGFSGG